MNSSKLHTPPSPRGTTLLRKSTAPFLPPPLLRLIHAVDTYVHLRRSLGASTSETLGEEPSMTLLSTVLVAYLIWRFVGGIARLFADRRSRIHLEESIMGHLGDKSGRGQSAFDETVLLCGAMDSGKTALLHRLCFEKEGWELPQTVVSIVANVGYLNNSDRVVRIIDYPGHSSSQLTQMLLPSTTTRVVFTIDSTTPINEAVSLLYKSILTNPPIRKDWTNHTSKMHILVACTKSDLRGSKNYKRIKIQMRNELERLRKVDSVLETKDRSNSNGGEVWSLKGKNVDLDDLGNVPIQLYFVEVALGYGDGGMKIVRDFVMSGVVPHGGTK